MSGRIVGSVCAVALTAAAALAAPAPSAPAAAAPAEQSVAELLAQLRTAYRKAEEATEAYNATEEKLRKQRTKTRALAAALARTRSRLAVSHDDAGRLAREQYQGRTQLSSYFFLMALLSPSPDQVTERTREMGRAADRQAILVEQLTRGEAHAARLVKRARTSLKKQLSLATKRKNQQDKVEKRLTAIEKKLASLSRRQIRALQEREHRDTEQAQRDLLASGALDPPAPDTAPHTAPGTAPDDGAPAPQNDSADTDGGTNTHTDTDTHTHTHTDTDTDTDTDTKDTPPAPEATDTAPQRTKETAPRRAPRRAFASAAAGQRALRYALKQIGKPYVWGAEGPGSFDCSGLTSQAWAHAGRPIPRTSQEQWRRLPRVKLNQLRPGDLVVYFKGASHVAIYAGNGMVVQAPRPGTRVKLSPLAANPLRGAVRPSKG